MSRLNKIQRLGFRAGEVAGARLTGDASIAGRGNGTSGGAGAGAAGAGLGGILSTTFGASTFELVVGCEAAGRGGLLTVERFNTEEP
jgi:hypothetical protein